MNIKEAYKKDFETKGYCVIKNAINISSIPQIFNEIENAKNTEVYTDKKGNLRRVERLYDKGKKLLELNLAVSNLLHEIFNEKFLIFKDKYNAKPPGGEGFFAHYDGVFIFNDKNKIDQEGWYKYTDFFINALVALDKCTKDNGTIEVSRKHEGSFSDLLQNTKMNGTPDLLKELEDALDFELIELNPGDLVLFSNACPHRSKKNKSDINRRTLYYTYTKEVSGSFYEEYFGDKKDSTNINSKSLSGES
ncbi:MAG: ectoine hydroxylase-related dioxygenase (phytanoyl-CoA dioxygenase family) [Gammaproteobacteria bacterium]|jgi:ectoine hydroxylase-related dioxygenase (phytanoyl-CoA dioxygenase family)|tara:strand:+ start:44 stop:790 length:747 start_codon:yes stop_codon:yes gene_type:complete